MKLKFKIDSLTFKVWDFVFSFKPEQMREFVHIAVLNTIQDYAVALEKTSG